MTTPAAKQPLHCLTPGCERKHSARGCCAIHYAQFRAAIVRGDTSWEELVADKLAAPLSTVAPGRPPKRIRCRMCEYDYKSLHQCAKGCGYSLAAVSLAVRKQVPMPAGHDWCLLGEND